MNHSAAHRFTVDEYYQLVEIGVLHPRSPVELLDGEVYDLSPPAPYSRPHQFSLEDYYRMARVGILPLDAKVELLAEVMHDMSPIGPLHGAIVNLLTEFFTLSAHGRWLVSGQNTAQLDSNSAPQPDLTLLKRAPDQYRFRHPDPDDILLLIEVADSTVGRDRGDKLAAYARSGIGEVWIVNLPERTVEVYRGPQGENYHLKNIVRAGAKLCPEAFPDVLLDTAELFNPASPDSPPSRQNGSPS